MKAFATQSHARLNMLAGEWDTEIVTLQPDGAAGALSRGTDIYRWMPNGQFLVHEVDVTMGETRVQSMEVFGVDADGGLFSRSFDPDGTVSDFTATIDGRTFGINGQLQKFEGEFGADGNSLVGAWQQRDAAGQWQPFVRLTLRRRA